MAGWDCLSAILRMAVALQPVLRLLITAESLTALHYSYLRVVEECIFSRMPMHDENACQT